MSLDSPIVEHLAKLAQIQIAKSDVDQISQELSKIIEYIDTLREYSGAGETTTQPASPVVERADTISLSLPLEDVMSQAPARETAGFRVPRVLDSDS
jgi:aspartyl-tRNA(Asn)/glutamyl-tRNA(Gln) amidotransferase subunit C